jgi:predicted nucleic acid-binding protein
MIHLDTNYLIFLLIPGSAEDRRVRGLRAAGEPINISTTAWAEFLCGPVSPADVQLARALVPSPEPVTADDATRAAALFNATGRRRNSLADCLIAATCLRLDATLATNNLSDFRPFQPHGLRLLIP